MITIPQIIFMLCLIESGNDPNVRPGIADDVGILQITPIMVKEANRVTKRSYTLEDRNAPSKSREIAAVFLSHQICRYRKAKGKYPPPSVLMGSWKSGSIFRRAGKRYRKKVEFQLNEYNKRRTR